MSGENHRIEFMVGDASGDGHGNTEEFQFICNRTEDEIQEAFKRGAELLDFDITQHICRENNVVTHEVLGKLREKGFKDEIEFFGKAPINLSADGYCSIYRFTCTVGDPALVFMEEPEVYRATIEIGGYELYALEY